MTETASPSVSLKGEGTRSVKGQAVRGARELQREVFNKQMPALMEIVFHTPLSLMPDGGWSVYICK
jgi:hypothetical protein